LSSGDSGSAHKKRVLIYPLEETKKVKIFRVFHKSLCTFKKECSSVMFSAKELNWIWSLVFGLLDLRESQHRSQTRKNKSPDWQKAAKCLGVTNRPKRNKWDSINTYVFNSFSCKMIRLAQNLPQPCFSACWLRDHKCTNKPVSMSMTQLEAVNALSVIMVF
jgi:hypothetical protein